MSTISCASSRYLRFFSVNIFLDSVIHARHLLARRSYSISPCTLRGTLERALSILYSSSTLKSHECGTESKAFCSRSRWPKSTFVVLKVSSDKLAHDRDNEQELFCTTIASTTSVQSYRQYNIYNYYLFIY